MNTFPIERWPIRLLILAEVVLLYLCTAHLVRFVYVDLWPSIFAAETPALRLFYIIVTLTTAVVVFSFYFIGYLLMALAVGHHDVLPAKWPRIRRLLDQVWASFLQFSLGNKYTLLLSFGGTLYILFIQDSMTILLAWQVLLLLTSFFIPLHYRGSPFVILLLLSCILVITVRLRTLQDYELLHHDRPLLIAALLSVLLYGCWGYIHRFIFTDSDMLPVALLGLLLGGCFTIFVLSTALTTLNCHYADLSTRIDFNAKIIQTCDYGNNSYSIRFLYLENGKERTGEIAVHPWAYHSAKVGGVISVHLHPGYLGWHWYHHSIRQRFHRSLIPESRILPTHRQIES